MIDLLALEEANLLHARRHARRNQWWSQVISCMQGLRSLYEYQGRAAEWARLVEEIRPDYCTDDDQPISGREDDYCLMMDYRVNLVQEYERDFVKAAALQEKLAGLLRLQAALVLALPPDAPLDNTQRHRLQTLGVCISTLGRILGEQGNAACLEAYQESLKIFRRIGDKPSQGIIEWNLGNAYKDLSSIYDLDAAEAAFHRSLNLQAANDALGRSRCIRQIGMVHYYRFLAANNRQDAPELQLLHARAAEEQLLQALQICPKGAFADLAPVHNTLANLYTAVGQFESARDHYELDARYEEKVGNHFGAGQTRFNIAVMYARAAGREEQPSPQRAFMLRARAYAEAALRDFQQYQGRAAADEAKSQNLIDLINQALAELPQ